MTEKRIRELYRDLVNDVDFEKLELELKAPNIFKILHISRNEIRHSNFLAWLLDPNENHGFGDLYLRKILERLTENDTAKRYDIFRLLLLKTYSFYVYREWQNIDILLLIFTL